MSTCTQIETKVQQRIRRPLHQSDSAAATMLNDAVNWAIREIQTRYIWQAMEAVAELSTTGGTDYVALPSGYVRMRPEMNALGCVFRLDGSKWVQIPQSKNGELVTLEQLRRLYPDPADTGEPGYCCVFGRSIYFGPTPDAAYDLRVPCYQRTAAIEDEDSNWFTDNLEQPIVTLAVGYCLEDLGEADMDTYLARAVRVLEVEYAQDAYEAAARVGPRSGRVRSG